MVPDLTGLLLLSLVVVLVAGYLLVQGIWRVIIGLGQPICGDDMNSRKLNDRVQNANRSKFGQLDMDSLRQQLRRWRKEEEREQKVSLGELNRQSEKVGQHLREIAQAHPVSKWTSPTCDNCGRQTWVNMAWRSGRVFRRFLGRRWPHLIICCPTCYIQRKQARPRWRRRLALWRLKLIQWMRSLL